MKISELMNELSKIYEDYGDLEIVMRNMDWNTLVHFKLQVKEDIPIVIVEPD